MELQFTCTHCGAAGITPEIGLLEGLSLFLRLSRLRCPACGSVLDNGYTIPPPRRQSPDFFVLPAGFEVLVRSDLPASSGGVRRALVLSDSDSVIPITALLITHGFHVITLPPTPAGLESLMPAPPELIILAAPAPVTQSLSAAILGDATLGLQYKRFRT